MKEQFFNHIDPAEMKEDLECIMGEVEVHHNLGIPINGAEVVGVYTYILASTYDRNLAYRETIDYIQEMKKVLYN